MFIMSWGRRKRALPLLALAPLTVGVSSADVACGSLGDVIAGRAIAVHPPRMLESVRTSFDSSRPESLVRCSVRSWVRVAILAMLAPSC